MAGDTIGSLVAIVKATADQFAADMKQVNRTLDELKNKARESGEGVKSAFEIGAAVELFKQGFEAAEHVVEQFFAVFEKGHQLEVLAEELNSTAGELSGFEFAAMEVGQSAESFENALGKMTQKIGEAREGSAKTSVAFEALGLNVNKLAGMTAGGALEEISDRIRQIPAAADRAAIAVELFGKKGREMLPMLMEGREGIEELIKKGNELGATLGTEQAAKLAEAQRNINEMKAQWQGLVNTIATAVLPIFNKLIGVLDWVIQKQRDAISAIKGGIDLITGDGSSEGREKGEQARAFGEELKRRQAEETKQNVIADLKEREKAGKEMAKEMAKQQEEVTRMSMREAEKMKEHAKHSVDEFARHVKQVTEAARSPMEKFNDTLKDLKSLLEVGAINFQTFEQAAAKAGAEVERAFDKHKEAQDHGMRGGIAAADLTTSTGASLDLAAGRALQDIQLKGDSIQEQQLESLQRHEALLQQIANAAGRGIDLGVADF